MTRTPVYSIAFINHAGASGTAAQVTVPHGYVYVVKFISVFSSPSFGPIRAFFKSFSTGATLRKDETNVLGDINTQLLITAAFNEGESFGWDIRSLTGDTCDVFASGYALTLP